MATTPVYLGDLTGNVTGTVSTLTSNIGNVTGNVSGNVAGNVSLGNAGVLKFGNSGSITTFTVTSGNIVITNLATSNPGVGGLWSNGGKLQIG